MARSNSNDPDTTPSKQDEKSENTVIQNTSVRKISDNSSFEITTNDFGNVNNVKLVPTNYPFREEWLPFEITEGSNTRTCLVNMKHPRDRIEISDQHHIEKFFSISFDQFNTIIRINKKLFIRTHRITQSDSTSSIVPIITSTSSPIVTPEVISPNGRFFVTQALGCYNLNTGEAIRKDSKEGSSVYSYRNGFIGDSFYYATYPFFDSFNIYSTSPNTSLELNIPTPGTTISLLHDLLNEFSPNGKFLISQKADKSYDLYAVDFSHKSLKIQKKLLQTHFYQWLSDSRLLMHDKNGVQVLDPRTGSVTILTNLPTSKPSQIMVYDNENISRYDIFSVDTFWGRIEINKDLLTYELVNVLDNITELPTVLNEIIASYIPNFFSGSKSKLEILLSDTLLNLEKKIISYCQLVNELNNKIDIQNKKYFKNDKSRDALNNELEVKFSILQSLQKVHSEIKNKDPDKTYESCVNEILKEAQHPVPENIIDINIYKSLDSIDTETALENKDVDSKSSPNL